MKREKFMMPILAVNHFESIPRTPDRQTKKNVSIGEKKKKKFLKIEEKSNEILHASQWSWKDSRGMIDLNEHFKLQRMMESKDWLFRLVRKL